MDKFVPNYQNIVDAARNRVPKRMPLYEHIIKPEIMEAVSGKQFRELANGNEAELNEYYRHYCGFFRDMGYDTVSLEMCLGVEMEGHGALGGLVKGVIQTREDFEKYPWDEVADRYFNSAARHFRALQSQMPEGMKAVGGIGNGVFELVQDLVGYTDLCYMRVDDFELYQDMFHKIGDVMVAAWERFLPEFGDAFCVCRFGDDLGFHSSTLLAADDIRQLIIPEYKRIIDLVHSYGKPFLLHSCGKIFDVMEDLIAAGIDAKHSNEDSIAPYREWIDRYGDRIGNFGGIDMNKVCAESDDDLFESVKQVFDWAKGGMAIGTGNSVPAYVVPEKYVAMVEAVRRLRGE